MPKVTSHYLCIDGVGCYPAYDNPFTCSGFSNNVKIGYDTSYYVPVVGNASGYSFAQVIPRVNVCVVPVIYDPYGVQIWGICVCCIWMCNCASINSVIDICVRGNGWTRMGRLGAGGTSTTGICRRRDQAYDHCIFIYAAGQCISGYKYYCGCNCTWPMGECFSLSVAIPRGSWGV